MLKLTNNCTMPILPSPADRKSPKWPDILSAQPSRSSASSRLLLKLFKASYVDILSAKIAWTLATVSSFFFATVYKPYSSSVANVGFSRAVDADRPLLRLLHGVALLGVPKIAWYPLLLLSPTTPMCIVYVQWCKHKRACSSSAS